MRHRYISKYVWVLRLKDIKGITKTNVFKKADESGHKPNKICVEKDEIYANETSLFSKI